MNDSGTGSCIRKADSFAIVVDKVRRERRWSTAGAKSGSETGSLHPMAIKVGCFSVTKNPFSRNFPAGSRAAPAPLMRVLSP